MTMATLAKPARLVGDRGRELEQDDSTWGPVYRIGGWAALAAVALFGVGGPPTALAVTCIAVLVVGVTLWLWSVGLILAKVPRGELITNGPFALMKHPIYTGFSLLVVPWIGFLLNTWLGALVGIVMYIGCRRYAPEEEAELSRTFGAAWDECRRTVKIPWL
jgi:protein-S-isoprenylcysteine O-methyltransferase Ste14